MNRICIIRKTHKLDIESLLKKTRSPFRVSIPSRAEAFDKGSRSGLGQFFIKESH